MSKITNDQLNLVLHRMLYSCTHMASAGVKGLSRLSLQVTGNPVKTRTIASRQWDHSW